MKSALRILFYSVFLSASAAQGQNSVGIGVADPNKNAVLELKSPNNNQGLLIPKLSTAQRTASSFTSGLTVKENGLMVFDSDDNTFYYWDTTSWKVFGGGGSNLTSGSGITIVNNTISTVPQDLKLAGNTLSITNNPSATSIDLSSYAGTSGAAGGDLSGTYPNPAVANNAINSAKIADNTITSADILNATIADADISVTANINTNKLSIGTNGQIITTSGGTAQWADPSGSVLINNAGTRNLFAGASVGGPGAGSSDNTFYGYSAGAPTTTGQWNVAMGANAGYRNTTGDLNVIIGWFAGSAVVGTGFNGNTMIGAQAGNNTTDGPNTFIGEKAGQTNTSGTLNTFIGNRTGLTNTLGYNNVLLGDHADVASNNLNNATAIGYQAVVDASNKVRIGNGSVTVIQGQVAFTAASDRRLKSNIESLTAGLDFISKLKPVSYTMKNFADQKTNWGFIAQDIEELVGTDNAMLTVGNDKDRTLGLRYTDFIAPLVKAVQEQQDEINTLNRKVDELTAEIEQIKRAIGLKAETKK